MNRMMMRNLFRTVWHTRGRFLAIFAIIALGSGFFAGVKATSPDMKQTADQYYADTHLMDLHLLSTIGFTAEEIVALRGLENVEGVYGCHSVDAFMQAGDNMNSIVKLYSMDFDALAADSPDALNRPTLLEGRMPAAADECLIEVNTPSEYGIGDSITLRAGEKSASLADTLVTDTFTVVGVVDWAMYVDFDRGITSIGNGTIDSFLLLPDAAFVSDVYTDAFISCTSARGLYGYGDAYESTVKAFSETLLDAAASVYEVRLPALREAAAAEIDVQEETLGAAKQSYYERFDAYEAEMTSALSALSAARAALVEQRLAWETAKNETYPASLAAYQNALAELDAKDVVLTGQETAAQETADTLQEGAALAASLKQLIYMYSDVSLLTPLSADIEAQLTAAEVLDSDEMNYTDKLREYLSATVGSSTKTADYSALSLYTNNYANTIVNQQAALAETQKQLQAARDTLTAGYAALAVTKTQLDATQAEFATQEQALIDAETDLDAQAETLELQKQESLAALEEAAAQIADGEAAIAAAEAGLDDIGSQVTWYAFNRSYNVGYDDYEEDADRVDSIARVFPVFFILVAALVCLTTMTRMVEEQRTEIGTLKALGYSRGTIMLQYLLYSAVASVLGVVVGLSVTLQLFPKAIFEAYKLMYNMPEIICVFRWDYFFGCLLAALLCTGVASLGACYRELYAVPAQLMRPKAPKNGKRVVLERIPFLWRHLSFNAKVTIRNLFRYKNRVLMTVIGIAGCTALMLAGFGLRNGISVIVDLQYDTLWKYDMIAVYDAETTTAEADTLRRTIDANAAVTDSLYMQMKSVKVYAGDTFVDATIQAVEEPVRQSDYITLRDRKTQADFTFASSETGIIVTEKLAKLLGVGVGDMLTLEGASQSVKISAVVENYVFHFVYMTPAVFTQLYGSYQPNAVMSMLTPECDTDALSETILTDNPTVLTVEFTAGSGQTFRELIQTLNYIVLLIIVSSGALAFVVLYNLANINITERIRELATIKVLGFYDGEVAAYIYRENTISALLGMAVGLFGGIFLTHYIVGTAEIDAVMFYPVIPPYAFVFAGLLTLLFTVLVNALLYWKLRKIDMASSMKAIE